MAPQLTIIGAANKSIATGVLTNFQRLKLIEKDLRRFMRHLRSGADATPARNGWIAMKCAAGYAGPSCRIGLIAGGFARLGLT
jgi:hypothetical protein